MIQYSKKHFGVYTCISTSTSTGIDISAVLRFLGILKGLSIPKFTAQEFGEGKSKLANTASKLIGKN